MYDRMLGRTGKREVRWKERTESQNRRGCSFIFRALKHTASAADSFPSIATCSIAQGVEQPFQYKTTSALRRTNREKGGKSKNRLPLRKLWTELWFLRFQIMNTKKINHSRSIIHPYGPISLLLLHLALIASAQAQPDPNDGPPGQNPYGQFNPSMLIIIFVLISAFFIMGFFSIYIRNCARESDSANGTGRQIGARGRSRRLMRGLDPAVIETFPTFEYSVVKGLKIGKGTLECAVCLNEFQDDETLRLLPKCSHVFHPPCIDAWLSSHTTCPVCRANLVPGSDTEAPAAEATDPGAFSGEEIQDAEAPDHVAITVNEDPTASQGLPPDVINPSQMPFPIQNRPIRSKSSRRPMRFPRSHSTGHSLVQPGENVDRYTLRLPEHVRKEIVSGRLNRTTSCVTFPTEGGSVSGGSSRGGRGYRSGGEGSNRGRSSFKFGRFDRLTKSDRWVFSMAPPFISRTLSIKSPRKADGDLSGSSRGRLPSVKTPFDCLGAKAEPSEQESARASTPVFTVSGQ